MVLGGYCSSRPELRLMSGSLLPASLLRYTQHWTLNIFVPFYRWVDIFTSARQLDYARFLVAQVRGELI